MPLYCSVVAWAMPREAPEAFSEFSAARRMVSPELLDRAHALLDLERAVFHRLDRVRRLLLDARDELGDLLRRGGGPRRELADLLRDDGEAAPVLAGLRGEDGGVERQQVGLVVHLVDHAEDAADLVRPGLEAADDRRGLPDRTADRDHALRRPAQRREPFLAHRARHLAGQFVPLPGVALDLANDGVDLGDRGRGVRDQVGEPPDVLGDVADRQRSSR